MLEEFVLKNTDLEVHITNLGATITHMITKDKNGKPVDVILGFDKPESYDTAAYLSNYPYLGAAIGRYANRIAKGSFELDGKTYTLPRNNGENALHGGNSGFDRKIWTVLDSSATTLTLQYVSEDGEEGFPGKLTVEISFKLEGKDFLIHYKATGNKNTPVNLTHHPYFNLTPAEADIKEHELKLFTDKYLESEELIPTEKIIKASGDYKFRDYNRLGNVIEHHDGLDDCYVFDYTNEIVKMAELYAPASGIRLTVFSNYPGLQVYTGKYLDVTNAKGGKHYGPFAGVALEAQFWPDSPNHPGFPSTILKAGEVYDKTTVFSFN